MSLNAEAREAGPRRIGWPRGLDWALITPLLLLTAVLFVSNVRSGYFLGDDSFISFRYARHLAAGQGLVWNPGERVEGYTNFLWVILMAGALRVGWRPELISNLIGIASGVVLLAVLVLDGSRRAGWRSPFIWLAPLALAAGRSFTAWCTGGLETMFFTSLVFAASAAFVRERETRSSLPILSSTLFALAALTRPEGGLFAAVAGLFLLGDLLAGRRSVRSALLWSLPCVDVIAAHVVWRYTYYGAWLPNTFYAKVAGAWWEQGLRYLRLFAEDYRIVWFLPLALLPLLRKERFAPAMFLSMLGAYLTYLACIGGDRFEYRFLVVVMPFFYLLVGDGLRWISGPPLVRRLLVGLVAAALLVTTHLAAQAPDPGRDHSGVASLHDIKAYAERRATEGLFLRGLIDDGLLPADLVLCVGGAGALPYYTDWPTVDRRGINDATIARLPLKERGVIGHEHDAPYEYLRERRVVLFDVFNQIVHAQGESQELPDTMRHDDRILPVRIVSAGGHELLFSTFVAEPEFRRTFAKVEIVR
jgi:arabinofuranosyltransferase